MEEVPRSAFIPPEYRDMAYEDRPLPIGFNQTISQPFIVAFMTECLQPKEHHTVLEIGTGSGYQAAILSRLVKKVYTIEMIKELAVKARDVFDHLGYNNIEIKIGDGYYGWAEHAPFDSIIVTAASPNVPELLIEQLKPGGKMCIPIGEPSQVQHLYSIEKTQTGETLHRNLLSVSFVPFQHSDTP